MLKQTAKIIQAPLTATRREGPGVGHKTQNAQDIKLRVENPEHRDDRRKAVTKISTPCCPPRRGTQSGTEDFARWKLIRRFIREANVEPPQNWVLRTILQTTLSPPARGI